jgi:hypothetical protein
MKSTYFTIHLGNNPPQNGCRLKSILFLKAPVSHASSTFPIQPDFSQNQPATITLNTGSPRTLHNTVTRWTWKHEDLDRLSSNIPPGHWAPHHNCFERIGISCVLTTVPGELSISYRWTGWVWEITSGWSSRPQEEILPIILEESIEGVYLKWRKQNREMMSTCNQLDWESLGSSPTILPKQLPGHWFWLTYECTAMIGENRQSVADEPVQFEK